MGYGVITIIVGAAAFIAGLAGLRAGRARAVWTAVLAVAGGVIATGGLLVQRDPDTASWLVAPLVGALLSAVHGRALFAPGGPFRT